MAGRSWCCRRAAAATVEEAGNPPASHHCLLGNCRRVTVGRRWQHRSSAEADRRWLRWVDISGVRARWRRVVDVDPQHLCEHVGEVLVVA
jgi:hypothetical protein